jgi:EAL domain-containing protein (putative c-di-GMP-specific phosphodiesterase class I)
MADPREGGPQGAAEAIPLDWWRRIEDALDRDLFVLHAQRIVDVPTGETMRHELFLRMVYRRRLIPAGEFLVAAEKFGSIGEIDRWVVSRAIEVAATGRAVDLNLSLRSTDEVLVDLIRTQLDRTGADPANLVLEVSEAQLAAAAESQSDFSETRGQFIFAVSELGCQVALDGFIQGGRGSFLLRQFPIGFVKLGAPFIKDLPTNRGKRRAVSSAVLKAHRSGQRVIAQGVENLMTLELLEDLGIDEAQGYALGPPESLESLLGTTA